MDQTPTDEEIIAAADRCAARSTDGTITSRDVWWELGVGTWRGYKGGHRSRQSITLSRISHLLKAAGFQTVRQRPRGYTIYRRP